MERRTELIHEESFRYDLWLKLILASVLLVTLVAGVMLISSEPEGAYVMFGITAFDGLLFYCIMPRRIQILDDRLRIVLGRPFAINIRYRDIREVRPAGGSKAFFTQACALPPPQRAWWRLTAGG